MSDQEENLRNAAAYLAYLKEGLQQWEDQKDFAEEVVALAQARADSIERTVVLWRRAAVEAEIKLEILLGSEEMRERLPAEPATSIPPVAPPPLPKSSTPSTPVAAAPTPAQPHKYQVANGGEFVQEARLRPGAPPGLRPRQAPAPQSVEPAEKPWGEFHFE